MPSATLELLGSLRRLLCRLSCGTATTCQVDLDEENGGVGRDVLNGPGGLYPAVELLCVQHVPNVLSGGREVDFMFRHDRCDGRQGPHVQATVAS